MSTTGNQTQAFDPGQLNVSLDGVNQGILAGDVGNSFACAAYAERHLLPNNFTWQVLENGTAYATIQVDLQGTIDFINWYQIDTTTTVGASQLRHVVNKPVRGVRVKFVASTGGDGTSNVQAAITA